MRFLAVAMGLLALPALANAQPVSPNALSVLDFGARCNVRQLHDLAGGPHLWVYSKAGDATVGFFGQPGQSVAFSGEDVGKAIVIAGIGANHYPLATKIERVTNATTIVVAAAPLVTARALPSVVAYGNDDGAAINAAIGSVPQGGRIRFPRGICGTASTIMLPSLLGATGYPDGGVSFAGEGQGASMLMALADMDAVAREATGWHLQARWSDLTVNGTGVATYALDAAGGYEGVIRDAAFINGLTADIRVGDGEHASQGLRVSATRLLNDATIFPGVPAMPAYNLLVNGSDNHFTDVDASGASTANFRDSTWGSNFYVALHGFGPAQYVFWFNGNATCAACEVDGATVGGVRMDGPGNVWTGGRMFFKRQNIAGVYGFTLGAGGNTIVWPSIADLPARQFVQLTAGGVRNNAIMIAGLSPVFGRPNDLIGTTTDAASATVLTLDGAAPSAANSIWLGDYSVVAVRGTLVVRDGATGGGAAWDVDALFTVGAPGAAPVLVKGAIGPLFTTGGLAFPIPPGIGSAPEAIGSFALTVRGVAGHTLHWKFTPVLSGVS
jgi:hypothetical protein